MNITLAAASVWTLLIWGFLVAILRTESNSLPALRRPSAVSTLGKDSVNWLAVLAFGGALAIVLLVS